VAGPGTANGTESLKDLMIRSMKDAAEVAAAVSELGLRAEDAKAIGLDFYISESKQ
jgi:hypothetical protein